MNKSESSNLAILVVDHDVMWLDIAVHNAHAVTVVKSF